MAWGTEREQQFVEQMGLAWEQEGVPRIAGRIFGLLLLQTSPCSLDDMASALGVSRASISTDARHLERLGLLRRLSRPGDRRDFYAIAPDAPIISLALKLERMRRMQASMGSDTFASDPAMPAVVRARLAAFREAHDRTIETLERLIAELRVQLATTLSVPGSPAS